MRSNRSIRVLPEFGYDVAAGDRAPLRCRYPPRARVGSSEHEFRLLGGALHRAPSSASRRHGRDLGGDRGRGPRSGCRRMQRLVRMQTEATPPIPTPVARLSSRRKSSWTSVLDWTMDRSAGETQLRRLLLWRPAGGGGRCARPRATAPRGFARPRRQAPSCARRPRRAGEDLEEYKKLVCACVPPVAAGRLEHRCAGATFLDPPCFAWVPARGTELPTPSPARCTHGSTCRGSCSRRRRLERGRATCPGTLRRIASGVAGPLRADRRPSPADAELGRQRRDAGLSSRALLVARHRRRGASASPPSAGATSESGARAPLTTSRSSCVRVASSSTSIARSPAPLCRHRRAAFGLSR